MKYNYKDGTDGHVEIFANSVNHAFDLFADKDVSSYLYDPVNAFQLVNRYNNGWMKLHEHVYTDNSQGW